MSDTHTAHPAGCHRHKKRRSHELRVVSVPRPGELRELQAAGQAIRATACEPRRALQANPGSLRARAALPVTGREQA